MQDEIRQLQEKRDALNAAKLRHLQEAIALVREAAAACGVRASVDLFCYGTIPAAFSLCAVGNSGASVLVLPGVDGHHDGKLFVVDGEDPWTSAPTGSLGGTR